MIHRAVLVLVLALGIATQLTRATEVSVTNTEDKLCLYANLMVNFSVTYTASGDKNETAVFTLPDTVVFNGSSCDNTSSTLKLDFGKGHSWELSFSKVADAYQADSITFSYSLADDSVFTNASSNETVSVKVALKDPSKVGIDTCYSCKSQELIQADGVNQTLWNVLIQAFVVNGSKSEKITPCAADVPATTTAATTTATAPTTQTSTAATTTPAPTSPPLPTPPTGDYNVTAGLNATACLMAKFGLRLGFHGPKLQDDYEMNLEPNGTSFTGTCGVNSSELVLNNTAMTLTLTFANDTNKFYLHAVNVTVTSSSGQVFTGANNNLTLWAASVGSSYMCNKEQVYNITDSLTFHTFDLQVQPFGVADGKFSTAHECSMDDTSLLIPIIVGTALTGLILIVVVAYVIGRRKTYVGYQTL